MLKLRKFIREYYPEYKSWFADPDLDRFLGPMDSEWLDCILSETEGCEYAVFRDDEMVGVVGIEYPDAEHPVYAITEIAVKPGMRKNGIGSEILNNLYAKYPLKENETWIAFVDKENINASAFLEANKWVCTSEQPDEHGMNTYEKRNPAHD